MPNNILITPGSASIQFSGSVDNSIRLQVQPSGAVDFISESVSLLSISNTGIITTASITVTGGGVTSSLFGTSSWANNSISASFANTASFFTGSVIFPSGLIVTGSILATTVSASLFIGPLTGTASFATSASFATTASFAISSSRSVTSSFATTSSFAVSASWAPSVGGVTSITAGNGLTGGEITSTGTITVDTGSVHFLDGVKKELNTEGVISSSGQVSYTGLSNVPANIVSSSAQVTAFLPAGTVSSSTQVNYTQLQNIPADIVSSSTFSSPSQGTVRAVINGIQTDVDTGLQTGDSPQFTNLNVSNVITASIVSASVITGSHVQLVSVVDTTSANKVLVLDTATNKIFTTASVGGGGGSGNGFPYNGTVIPAVISGSLIISSSHNSPVTISGSTDSFFELEVVNFSAGNNASSDVVVSSNNTTDVGNYASFGINSTTFNGPLVGGASDAYLYVTSSVGELDIGHAHPGANSNIRLFTGGQNSTANTRVFISASGQMGINSSSNLQHTLTVNGTVLAPSITGSLLGTSSNAITASFVLPSGLPVGLVSSSTQINTGSFSGSLFNIIELSMAVSGTITASGTIGVSLDLNQANYFTVSGSAAGTVTWTVTNPPASGRAQTFIIEYTNGGIKTNNWFTNTRWPAGVAPSLTSASANPDLLGFTTDDAGANWRGVLLQRGSA